MAADDGAAVNKVVMFVKGINLKAVVGRKIDSDNRSSPTFDQRSRDVLMPRKEPKRLIGGKIDHTFECIEKGMTCLKGIRHPSGSCIRG